MASPKYDTTTALGAVLPLVSLPLGAGVLNVPSTTTLSATAPPTFVIRRLSSAMVTGAFGEPGAVLV